MHKQNRIYLIIGIVIQGFIFPLVSAQAQAIKIPDIVAWHSGKALPIAIESNDSTVRSLATKAFKTHGQYKVVKPSQAGYIFDLKRTGANTVTLAIRSGPSRQIRQSKRVTGSGWVEATLRACDFAVTQTSRLPGYFAGRLVFVGERTRHKELFVSDLFFQRVQQVTHDRSESLFPRWSPDGKKILYTGYFHSGFPDIFLLDLKTERRMPFATYKGINTSASFSPKGDLIAMTLSHGNNPEIYITDTRGRIVRRLTRVPSIETSPTWSPNGRHIIMTSDIKGKPQLYQIKSKGGKMRRIPTNISGYCAEPAWNPRNEDQIVFTAAMGKTFQLALYDAKKRKSRFLTRGPGDAIEGRWTNDGRHIIYTQRQGRAKRLMIIDSESGKTTPLHSPSLGQASQSDFVYVQSSR